MTLNLMLRPTRKITGKDHWEGPKLKQQARAEMNGIVTFRCCHGESFLCSGCDFDRIFVLLSMVILIRFQVIEASMRMPDFGMVYPGDKRKVLKFSPFLKKKPDAGPLNMRLDP